MTRIPVPEHPARSVWIENDQVPVGNDYTDPLIIGGEELAALGETLRCYHGIGRSWVYQGAKRIAV